VLSKYYSWSHEDTGKLTPRQARGYYQRIIEVQKMFSGSESEEDGDWDINAILDEAEALNIPTPPR